MFVSCFFFSFVVFLARLLFRFSVSGGNISRICFSSEGIFRRSTRIYFRFIFKFVKSFVSPKRKAGKKIELARLITNSFIVRPLVKGVRGRIEMRYNKPAYIQTYNSTINDVLQLFFFFLSFRHSRKPYCLSNAEGNR